MCVSMLKWPSKFCPLVVVWLVWPNTDAFQSVFLVLVLCIGHVANRQSINSNQRERERESKKKVIVFVRDDDDGGS